jgi:hypothetical protein
MGAKEAITAGWASDYGRDVINQFANGEAVAEVFIAYHGPGWPITGDVLDSLKRWFHYQGVDVRMRCHVAECGGANVKVYHADTWNRMMGINDGGGR